jgi:hypothetical protein
MEERTGWNRSRYLECTHTMRVHSNIVHMITVGQGIYHVMNRELYGKCAGHT